MGQFVIVAYRPRKGKEAQLLDAIRDHLPILREQGLATDRPSLVMRSGNGTIVEVFEWKSAKAVEEAHSNQAVQALWGRFEAACEYESLANLPESREPFAHFEPVEL